MLIRIESCGECPARRVTQNITTQWWVCQLRGTYEATPDEGLPSWCPLREREVSRSMEKRVDVQDTPPCPTCGGSGVDCLTCRNAPCPYHENDPPRCERCKGTGKVESGWKRFDALTSYTDIEPCPDCQKGGRE